MAARFSNRVATMDRRERSLTSATRTTRMARSIRSPTKRDVVTYTVGSAGRVTKVSDSSNNYVGYSGNTATYTPNGSLRA